MRLQEEYFKRHSLPFNPIYHTRDTRLILKNKPPIIFNIEWKEPERTTGHYEIFYSKPIHNSYLKSEYFTKLDVNRLEYNEYFSFISNWSKNFKFEIIKNVKIVSWEIFVYCFDGWIANHSLENKIFPTIDPLIPNEHKEANINEFVDYLKIREVNIYNIFNRFFSYKHENWIVKLTEKGDNL